MNLLIFVFLGGSIVFLAYFGAGIFAWTVCAAAAAASLMHILCAGRAEATPRTGRFPAVERAYGALLVFLLTTLIPLPLGLAHVAGGRQRHMQNAPVAKALDAAADRGILERRTPLFSLTRNRAGTMRIAMLAIAACGVALLSSMLSMPFKKAYLYLVSSIAAAVAVGGFIGQWRIPQGDTLWWTFPIPHVLPGPIACFVNRNHYAGYLAMTIPIPLALLADNLSRRQWFAALPAAGLLSVIGLGVLFSLSRGGMMAAGVALIATAVLFVHRRRWGAGIAIALAAAALTALAVAVATPAVKTRLETLRDPLETPSVQTRLSQWSSSLKVWIAYPVIGAGANGLRMVYPQHRTTTESGFLSHCENEYVQLLAEGGIVGLTLFGALVWALARHGPRRSTPGESDDVIVVAAGGALAVAAVHAVFDFPIRVPLYAVTLASLTGLLLVRPDAAGPARPSLFAWPVLLGFAAAVAMTPLARAMQDYDSIHRLDRLPPQEIGRALSWAPTSWYAWYCLGSAASAEERIPALRFGEYCLSRAADYDPNNYKLWNDLGTLRLDLRDYAGARQAFRRVRELRSWMETPAVPGY